MKIPAIDPLIPEDSRENIVPCQEILFILEWYKEHQKRMHKSLHDIYHSHISKGIFEVVKTAYLSSDEDLPEIVTMHELRALISCVVGL